MSLPAYRARLLERLGIFPVDPTVLESLKSPKTQLKIWIHAVSVGEIRAALPIIVQLQQKLAPKQPVKIILTCTTPAGSALITKYLTTYNLLHIYAPLDLKFAVNNFLTRIQPNLLILIEKEIWPNIIHACFVRKIPIMLANAQLSAKSLKKYLWLKPLTAALLRRINLICPQNDQAAEQFNQIANDLKIQTTGNTKFDLAWQASDPHKPKLKFYAATKQPWQVWIAISTHPVEEDLILAAHKILLTRSPHILLILAPRHPHRTTQILKNLDHHGLTATIYSQQRYAAAPNFIPNQVYVIDTIGELNSLYQASDVAFVGGSLVPGIGGHNMLEPAAYALPITIGPYTHNCQELVDHMQAQAGAVVVATSIQLADTVYTWLTNQELRLRVGQNAQNYLVSKLGASAKIADLAINLLHHS